MNKQEAQKEIEKAQKKFDKLQKKLDIARDQIAWAERMLEEAEPDTSELVFNPKQREVYVYIGNHGLILKKGWHSTMTDLQRLEVGNCFRTEEDARNSAKYYIMNSEYDYWLPWTGQPKPKVLPKGLEYWNNEHWIATQVKDVNRTFECFVYRWKRSEQV